MCRALLINLLAVSAHSNARCGEDAFRLSDVQGKGNNSPLVGQKVTVEGIITLDSRNLGGWRGFYLQQADTEIDNDPDTSEALFIYTNRKAGNMGDRIRVTGRVKEYHGLTELTQVSGLKVCGREKLPRAIPVSLPWPADRAPENLENMLVRFVKPLSIIGAYSFARYGEITLASEPQVTPTQVMPPGPKALAMAEQQSLHRLFLDDGKSIRDPRPLPWPSQPLMEGKPVRAGDRLNGLTGILDFRFGHWRLQSTEKPRLTEPSQRPSAPVRSPRTTLRLVTYNLHNFFNGDGRGTGFGQSRGARNPSQLNLQTSRLIATLKAINPDIIAAVEMENDDYGSHSAIAHLANALGPEWRFVKTPGVTGTDAIRTDLLYRHDRVETLGQPLRFAGEASEEQGRPSLAQVFRPTGGQQQASVRVLVSHFKSKACGGATGADRDQKDGQGCYARRRTESAQALADWLASLPAPRDPGHPFAGTLVTGDLNSYAREWPIQRLEEAGLTNLIRSRYPCTLARCPQTSYRFQGRKGSLDYSLGSAPLLDYIVDAGVWPINAEEFPVVGYQGPLAAPDGTPWRSSDHNPLYTDLSL